VRKTNPKSKCKKPCANCGKEAGLAGVGVFFSLNKTGFINDPDSDMSLIFCNPCADIATENEKGKKRVCNITRTGGEESTFHFCGHNHKAYVLDKDVGPPYFGGFSEKEVDGEVELFFAQHGEEPHQVTLKGIPFRKSYTRHIERKTPTACESHSHAVQPDVSTVSKMDTDTNGSDTETDTDDNAGMEV